MKKFSLALAILLFGLTLAPIAVLADNFQTNGTQFQTGGPQFQTNGPSNCGGNAIFCIPNPLGANSSLCTFLKAIFNIILLFGIPIATFFVMYAGFRLVLARGNPGALEKAKLNLWHVLIGIAIFLGAWLLGQIIATTIKDLGINVPGLNNC